MQIGTSRGAPFAGHSTSASARGVFGLRCIPRCAMAAGASNIASARIGNEMMLRLEIEELHAAYSYCLDHGNLDDWPELFTEDCLYKLISRENWDLGLPLGTMFAEKRGGLLDRINAVKETSVYHERYLTHMITNTRVLGEQGGVVVNVECLLTAVTFDMGQLRDPPYVREVIQTLCHLIRPFGRARPVGGIPRSPQPSTSPQLRTRWSALELSVPPLPVPPAWWRP